MGISGLFPGWLSTLQPNAADDDTADDPRRDRAQMMIARDDSAIFVKTAGANGQTNLDVFVKRAPKPVEPPIDLNRFITREEFERRIAQLNAPQEALENEPV